jgi:thiol:disulfide interchange protein DsbC
MRIAKRPIAKRHRAPQVSPSPPVAVNGHAVRQRQPDPGRSSMTRPPRHSRAWLPVLALAGSALQAAPPLPPALTDLSAPLRASVRLPGTGVQMLELAERVVYVAGSGRYAFTGAAWDLWHGERLDSVAQATALAARIDLRRMALDPAELGAFTIATSGSDAPTQPPASAPVWVFVDPLCPECAALLAALEHSGTAAHVVLLPVGGTGSLDVARRLLCAPSRDAAWSALTEQDWAGLPEPAADCDTEPLVRALITARLLGIASVPTLIAPDGRLQRGVPADLQAWLAAE